MFGDKRYLLELLFSIFWSSMAYITNEKQENNILEGIKELNHLFSVFQIVNTVLRALQHVLVLGCSEQNQNLGPLLASLKVLNYH